MVGDSCVFTPFVYTGKRFTHVRSLILRPKCDNPFLIPFISSSIYPTPPVSYSSLFPPRVAFSSSAQAPPPSTPKITGSSTPSEFPPPVNPPETEIPDPVTLREQWRYATRMYSRWYAHAWGTAILAGLSFYALGWLVKGENPVSRKEEEKKEEK